MAVRAADIASDSSSGGRLQSRGRGGGVWWVQMAGCPRERSEPYNGAVKQKLKDCVDYVFVV